MNSMASWSLDSLTVTGDPLEQNCAAEAAAESIPSRCHLEKAVTRAWPARVKHKVR